MQFEIFGRWKCPLAFRGCFFASLGSLWMLVAIFFGIFDYVITIITRTFLLIFLLQEQSLCRQIFPLSYLHFGPFCSWSSQAKKKNMPHFKWHKNLLKLEWCVFLGQKPRSFLQFTKMNVRVLHYFVSKMTKKWRHSSKKGCVGLELLTLTWPCFPRSLVWL